MNRKKIHAPYISTPDRIPGIRVRPKPVDYRSLLHRESTLIPHILLYQNTIRAHGVIPTWSNYFQHPVFRDVTKDFDSQDLRKYRAWWIMLFEVMRDARDRASVALALCYLIAEKRRRDNGPVMNVPHARHGISDEHAAAVREHVLKNFDSLHPPRSAALNMDDAFAHLELKRLDKKPY